MQWRNIGGSEAAHRFDLLVCRLQTEHPQGVEQVRRPEGRDCSDQARRPPDEPDPGEGRRPRPSPRSAPPTSGTSVTVAKLEDVRGQLRGVMQYRHDAGGAGSLPPKVIDIKEDPSLIERKKHVVKLEGLQLAAYRNRVEKVLRDLFETNETLQRIKPGQPVSEADLEALTLAGADAGPDARPARPGRILPRLRRATRPGDPQHHRPGCRRRSRAVHRLRPASTRPELGPDPVPGPAPEPHRQVRRRSRSTGSTSRRSPRCTPTASTGCSPTRARRAHLSRSSNRSSRPKEGTAVA